MPLLFFLLIHLIQSTPSLKGKTYVLLIGIDDYTNTDLNNLRGVEADLDLMASLFNDLYDSPLIKLLFNTDATHQKITDELKQLQCVRNNDTVIIYFVGHGSTAKDMNHDERSGSGLDSTWVTFGSRHQNHVQNGAAQSNSINDYDILDDEINEYLWKIPTERLILISDSCSSGSIGRDNEIPSLRGVHMDDRQHPLAMTYSGQRPIKGIRFGAAHDQSKAMESYVDGAIRGRFTWALDKAIRERRKDERWIDLLTRVRAIFHNKGWLGQEPQMEGDKERPLNFGQPGISHDKIKVNRVRKDCEVILPVGLLSGIGPGSEFGNEQVQLVVRASTAYRSTAYRKNGSLPEPGGLLHLTKGVLPNAPARVAVHARREGKMPKIWAAWIKQRLKAYGDPIQIISDDEPGDTDWVFQIVHRPKGDHDVFSLPEGHSNDELEIWVTDQNGTPMIHKALIAHITQKPSPKDSVTLNQTIQNLVKQISLLQINEQNKAMDFSFQLEVSDLEGKNLDIPLDMDIASIQSLEKTDSKPSQVIPKGTLARFILKNTGKRGRFFYVIKIAPDGAIQQLFPPLIHNDSEGFIEEGKTFRLDSNIQFLQSGLERFWILSSDFELDPMLFVNDPPRTKTETKNLATGTSSGPSSGDNIQWMNSHWSTRIVTLKVGTH